MLSLHEEVIRRVLLHFLWTVHGGKKAGRAGKSVRLQAASIDMVVPWVTNRSYRL